MGADLDTCGQTCGEPDSDTDACCRSNDPNRTLDWDGTWASDSILTDWATGRFNEGDTWTWDNTVDTPVEFEVPAPVEGNWVARSYVPDVSQYSPYRCNDDTSPVRPRALIGASVSTDNVNSATAVRWQGLAVYIDPIWDFANLDIYEDMTIFSHHLPNNYTGAGVGGGGMLVVSFRRDYADAKIWRFSGIVAADTEQHAIDAGCDSADSSKVPAYSASDGFWGCPGRDFAFFEFVPSTDQGHWIFFVWQLKPSTSGGNDGIMNIWMKRYNEGSYTQIVDSTDHDGYVGPSGSTPGYFKAGISDKTDGFGVGQEPKIVYYDALKIGDSSSSFSEVEPVQDVASCDSEHFPLCTTEGDCTTAGGYWCTSVCQASPCADPQTSVVLHGTYISGGLIE